MASVPRWVERELDDVPFSDMSDFVFIHDEDWAERRKSMSQTSGVNPGLYTNYKKKPSKAKPKGK